MWSRSSFISHQFSAPLALAIYSAHRSRQLPSARRGPATCFAADGWSIYDDSVLVLDLAKVQSESLGCTSSVKGSMLVSDFACWMGQGTPVDHWSLCTGWRLAISCLCKISIISRGAYFFCVHALAHHLAHEGLHTASGADSPDPLRAPEVTTQRRGSPYSMACFWSCCCAMQTKKQKVWRRWI